MKCLITAFGLIMIILVISSCSDDGGFGISHSGQRFLTSLENSPQAPKTSRNAAGYYVFYVDANGIILSSAAVFSMDPIRVALSEHAAAELDGGGIVEIQERNIIEKIFEIVGGNDPKVPLSSVVLIGIMSFNDCVAECCGDTYCSWGTLKYCLNKCSEDHEPKPEQP